jgi:TonB family protein
LEPDVNAALKKKLIWGGVALAVVAAVVVALVFLLGGHSSAPAKAPKISVMPVAPPPPPPKEEKKPDPPKEQKDVKTEQQIPKDAPPAPPSADLKMDGPAGDGPSAFSAGKITSDDLSKALGNGSGLFNPFTNFANAVKGDLQRYLTRQKELRVRAYKVEVQLWIDRDGQLTRHQIVGSTGDADIDALISKKLETMGRLAQTPPERMPQPIRLRLVIGG